MMATAKLPDPLELRHLVVRDIPEAKSLALAEAYLAEGRSIEAVDFLSKAGATERLAELRREAVQSGDAFLMRAISSAMDEAPGPAEWEALADAADAAGKERYAADARRQAEREED